MGKMFTKIGELLESNKIKSPSMDHKFANGIFKRLLKEIKDVNNDFFNLRTIIVPDPDGSAQVFYFLMISNDRIYCHMPLLGRFIISDKYPNDPPYFHMITRTGRMNVDIFNNSAVNNLKESSMCFDILKPPTNIFFEKYSTWESNHALFAVFSAIMQSIVSTKVPQMYGREIQQLVTMELLRKGYKYVIDTLEKYIDYVPSIP